MIPDLSCTDSKIFEWKIIPGRDDAGIYLGYAEKKKEIGSASVNEEAVSPQAFVDNLVLVKIFYSLQSQIENALNRIRQLDQSATPGASS